MYYLAFSHGGFSSFILIYVGPHKPPTFSCILSIYLAIWSGPGLTISSPPGVECIQGGVGSDSSRFRCFGAEVFNDDILIVILRSLHSRFSEFKVCLAVTTMRRNLILTFPLFALCVLGKHIKVNLQWAICDADPQTVLRRLGEDGTREPYKKTPITYYDTNPPSYFWGGLMFRTKTRRGEELSAVKVRLDPKTSNAPEGFFHNEEAPIVEAHFDTNALDTQERFLCVWDRYGNDTYFACQIQSLLAGRKKLWAEEQIRFAERCQRVTWENLVGFGPNPNPKWRLSIFGHRAVFDDVQAGTSHLMELEVKVHKHKGDEVYEKISNYLRERGIALCHKQEPRTLRLFQAMGYDGNYHNMVKQPG